MLTIVQKRNGTKYGNKTSANMGLAKGGLTYFVETFVQDSTFVLRMKICAKNPALRQAQNRYAASL